MNSKFKLNPGTCNFKEPWIEQSKILAYILITLIQIRQKEPRLVVWAQPRNPLQEGRIYPGMV